MPGAAAKLSDVEATLAEARRDQERATLADQERRDRAAGADAADRAERATEARTRALNFLAESRTVAAEIDLVLGRAVILIQRFRELRRQACAAVQGVETPQWLAEDVLRGSVAWRFMHVLGGHAGYLQRTHRAFWKPLGALLAYEAAEASPPARAEETPSAPAEETCE